VVRRGYGLRLGRGMVGTPDMVDERAFWSPEVTS
jgi:hypothetical protein